MKLKSLLITAITIIAVVAISDLMLTQLAFGQQLTIAKNYRPAEGQPHPDFTLPAIDDGRKIALSQFRGKKVVLIHFASW
jgi:peroxiredoxin